MHTGKSGCVLHFFLLLNYNCCLVNFAIVSESEYWPFLDGSVLSVRVKIALHYWLFGEVKYN